MIEPTGDVEVNNLGRARRSCSKRAVENISATLITPNRKLQQQPNSKKQQQKEKSCTPVVEKSLTPVVEAVGQEKVNAAPKPNEQQAAKEVAEETPSASSSTTMAEPERSQAQVPNTAVWETGRNAKGVLSRKLAKNLV